MKINEWNNKDKQKEGMEFDFEQLIQQSLAEDSLVMIPDDFAHRMTGKVEDRMVKKSLLEEWGLKLALIAGVVAILFGVMWFVQRSFDEKVLTWLQGNGIILLLVVLLGLFIYFMDQVILKYMFYRQAKH